MNITPAKARALGIEAGARTGRRDRKPASRPAHNVTFPLLCQANGLPVPLPEHKFNPDRDWRVDWIFDGWLVLEVDGQVHRIKDKFSRDMEKYNTLAIMGFTLLRCTPKELVSGAACMLVKRAMLSFAEMAQ